MKCKISQEEEYQIFRFQEKHKGEAPKIILKKLYKRAWDGNRGGLRDICNLADNLLDAYLLGRRSRS